MCVSIEDALEPAFKADVMRRASAIGSQSGGIRQLGSVSRRGVERGAVVWSAELLDLSPALRNGRLLGFVKLALAFELIAMPEPADRRP
jgi:hypothetical protein